jgi:hypothetical protein
MCISSAESVLVQSNINLILPRAREFPFPGLMVSLGNKYNKWSHGIRKRLRNIYVFLCLRYNPACMGTGASTVNISFVHYNYISISHKKFNNQSASVQILIYKFEFDYILIFTCPCAHACRIIS